MYYYLGRKKKGRRKQLKFKVVPIERCLVFQHLAATGGEKRAES